MTGDALILIRFVGGAQDGHKRRFPQRFARPGLRLRMPRTPLQRPSLAFEEEKPLVFVPRHAEKEQGRVVTAHLCEYELEERDGELVAVYKPPG